MSEKSRPSQPAQITEADVRRIVREEMRALAAVQAKVREEVTKLLAEVAALRSRR